MRMNCLAPPTWLGILLCLALFPTAQIGAAGPSAPPVPTGESIDNAVKPNADNSYSERSYSDGDGCAEKTNYIGCEGCNLCPCSYVWAEGLILTRDNQSNNRPLILDVNTSQVLLSAGDLDFDWSGGLRVGYDTRICGCLSAEFVYLGVFDQSVSAGVELQQGLMLPGDFGTNVNNFGFDDTVGVRYSSDLHSFEANLVRCCCCRDCCGHGRSVEFLAGFRYIRFDEDFSLTGSDSAEGTSVYAVETENNLYGAQVGARYRGCRGCWSWEATGKAGIYANEMEESQAPIVDFPGFVFRTGRGSDNTDVAFVGDLNFTAIYQLNCVWALRAGYNLIWLDGVALAPDQLDFTNTPASGKRLVDDGGVLLHGVNVGLEARW